MRDSLFSGQDVAEALAAASRALGLPADSLRHVVLDPGSPGVGRGPGRPAQIAVLLDRGTAPAPAQIAPAQDRGHDPAARLRGLLRAVAEAADIDIDPEVSRQDDIIRVRILGPESGFFLGEDGAVLLAVQHLLQRGLDPHGPERVLVECEGYRERRETALRAQAATLAEAVLQDGQPRAFGPLNSYERRIVHVALAGVPGVRSVSVGEGSERRVTVVPAPPEAGEE